MKKLMAVALATATMAATAPLAAAQDWRSINQRQAQLDQRIDVGVRNGSLTRAEANRLRDEYRDIARLEVRYRRGGLSQWERNDLDRRFDNLSSSIRYQRHDAQERGRMMSVNQRQENIDRRIEAGMRNDQLTWIEAARLRSEYRGIANLEARYRRDGLQPAERRYLNYRLTHLSREIRDDRHDEDLWWF